MSRPNAVSIVLITAILLVALISSTIAKQHASYTRASLTGYKYCAARSTILKRSLTGEQFTFQGAKQLCQTKGGHLVSVHAISIGCVSDLIPLGLTVWIDDLLPGSGGKIAYVTAPIGILISSTRNRQHVVCEIPCHRSAGDRIASISKTGSVTCIPGDKFDSLQPVCSDGTHVGKCDTVSTASVVAKGKEGGSLLGLNRLYKLPDTVSTVDPSTRGTTVSVVTKAPARPRAHQPRSKNPFCEQALNAVERFCRDIYLRTWKAGDRCHRARKGRRLYCTYW
ncbi:uncharacterized protein LOC135813709 isoform X2 [Sycon ciliatum]|uniref:uncharacterized protein LOC135813709 isoform X2 n=1 Tax=Sycon ciliatum TaxID=27933 RepID=UPI0031F6C739